MRRPYIHKRLNVSDLVLETDRLIIRAWYDKDLNDLYDYASVDGVGQMAGWTPHKTIEDSKAILFNFMMNQNVFALELKSNQRVVGSISIEKIYVNHLGEDFKALKGREIGFVLSKDYWGLGLMPEALEKVLEYLSKEMDYDYLMCAHFEKNKQSKRVIEKIGFEFIKEITVTTLFEVDVKTFLYVKCFNN